MEASRISNARFIARMSSTTVRVVSSAYNFQMGNSRLTQIIERTQPTATFAQDWSIEI